MIMIPKKIDEAVVLSYYSYGDALKEVLRIRDQRQQIYSDDWKEQADWELLALIKMKVKRLEHFVVDKKDENVYESRVDTIIDAINYSLFLLQNTIDKGK